MPTKGNTIIKCRVLPDLEKEVEATIKRRNLWSDNEPWDVSAFIRSAIREKIQHMERSRRKRPGRTKRKREEHTVSIERTTKGGNDEQHENGSGI